MLLKVLELHLCHQLQCQEKDRIIQPLESSLSRAAATVDLLIDIRPWASYWLFSPQFRLSFLDISLKCVAILLRSGEITQFVSEKVLNQCGYTRPLNNYVLFSLHWWLNKKARETDCAVSDVDLHRAGSLGSVSSTKTAVETNKSIHPQIQKCPDL